MKICLLTPRFPFPENGGDVLRINHIARYLKHQGHQLTLVSFTQSYSNVADASQCYDHIYTVRHSRLCAFLMAFMYMLVGRPLQCGYYQSMRYKKVLRRAIKEQQPDIFVGHLLRMAPYLDNNEMRNRSIIEMTDALSRTYKQSTSSGRYSPMQLVYWIENRLIRRYEDYAIQRFPKSVLVSQTDVDLLQSRVPNSKLAFHTNGVNVAEQPLMKYNQHKICFVGNMRTLQNQDAVLYFVEDILPLIVEKDPLTVFYIIGAQPSSRITQLAHNPHVVVTDFVESVEKVLSDACVSVAPVRIAAGIQNKILVAMGQRVPVVMSSLIAAAIPELKNDSNCMIRDDAMGVAEACLMLMQHNELRQRIAKAGYAMVAKCYDWNERLSGYESLL